MTLEAIVPQMLSNNTPPPFTAYASNQLASYAAFHAFRDDLSGWISDVVNSYIQVDLGRPYDIQRIYLDSETNLTDAKMEAAVIYGSTDNKNWRIIYNGAMTNYKFDKTEDFGTFRYIKVQPKKMTSRGGSIRYLQLFKDDFGATLDVEQEPIWIDNGDVEIKANLYVDEGRVVLVSTLIDGVVVDEPVSLDEDGVLDIVMANTKFKPGGSLITLSMENEDGTIRTKDIIVYKISNLSGRRVQQAYVMNIHTTPRDVVNQDKVFSHYPMSYMLYDNASGSIFKYMPFDRIPSRVDTDVHYADLRPRKVSNGDAFERADRDTVKLPYIRETFFGHHEIKNKAYILNGYRDAVRIRLAIKNLMQAWGSLLELRQGIAGEVEIAFKRLKIGIDYVAALDLNSFRKNELKDTIAHWAVDTNAFKKVMEFTDDEINRVVAERFYKNEAIIGEMLAASSINKEALIMIGYINAMQETGIGHLSDDYLAASLLRDYEEGIESNLLHATRNMIEGHATDMLVSRRNEVYGHIEYINNAETFENYGIILEGYNNTETPSIYGHFDVGYQNVDIKNPNIGIIGEYVNIHQKLKPVAYFSEPIIKTDKIGGKELSNNDVIVFTEVLPIEARKMEWDTYVGKLDDEVMVTFYEERTGILELQMRLYDEDIITYIDKMPTTGEMIMSEMLVDKMEETIWVQLDETLVDKMEQGIRRDVDGILVTLMPYNMDNFQSLYLIDRLEKDADFSLTDFSKWVDKLEREINEFTVLTIIEKTMKDIFYLKDEYPINSRAEKISKDIERLEYIEWADMFTRDIWTDLNSLKILDKMARESRLENLIVNISKEDKYSLIAQNFETFVRKVPELYIYQEEGVKAAKEEMLAHAPNMGNGDDDGLRIASKKEIDGHIERILIAKKPEVDAYIYELVSDIIRDDELEAIESLNAQLADKAQITILTDVVKRATRSKEKAAKVDGPFVLASGESDWEDIFNKYSPGVDILDPPDADYDYSTLTARVYDHTTGVPYAPVGATNEAICIVETPLHHPIPQHSEVGVDDTKRIAVDNFIFIDCLLALETIKSKDAIRYAGMSASKTVQEVFSSLYLWIQGAAPDHEEYQRMFRFMRWYAEAVVFRHTKQKLIREYDPWRSTLHLGMDLGIGYTATGWNYMMGYNALKTTSLSNAFTFHNENYIDGKVIVRGYFDNPALQGTMEIAVDGTVVSSLTKHGGFTHEFDIPQGNHMYRFSYTGISGEAAISSIEISGTKFVSARTETDESDSNGLKALNMLMSQLLGYFELHHGGGKVKGTMEVRQRAVWNTHT